MRGIQLLTLFLGRMLLSLFFISSGVFKIIDWQNSQRGLITLFCDWHVYMSSSLLMQKIFSSALAWIPAILMITTLLELVGGLLLLFGIKVRIAALLLIILLVPTTLLFHQFWFLEGYRRDVQMVMFLKNLAILGGLIYAVVFSPGRKAASGAGFDSEPVYDDI